MSETATIPPTKEEMDAALEKAFSDGLDNFDLNSVIPDPNLSVDGQVLEMGSIPGVNEVSTLEKEATLPEDHTPVVPDGIIDCGKEPEKSKKPKAKKVTIAVVGKKVDELTELVKNLTSERETSGSDTADSDRITMLQTTFVEEVVKLKTRLDDQEQKFSEALHEVMRQFAILTETVYNCRDEIQRNFDHVDSESLVEKAIEDLDVTQSAYSSDNIPNNIKKEIIRWVTELVKEPKEVNEFTNIVISFVQKQENLTLTHEDIVLFLEEQKFVTAAGYVFRTV